jgi:hypothetical protein
LKGRRKPEGPAKVLLIIAAKHPQAILDAVHNNYNDNERIVDGKKFLILRILFEEQDFRDYEDFRD